MSTAGVEPTRIEEVETSLGLGRLNFFGATSPDVRLVLGHGAGGGIHARDLQAIAEALPHRDVEVVLVEQPWVVAGKKVAPNPARLDEAWIQLFAAVGDGPRRTVVGGRSAGARVAVRTAAAVEAAAVVALAFPLHPPGKPERTRSDELLGVDVPTLIVQGTADSFGSANEIAATVGKRSQFRVTRITDADHGFKVPARSPHTTNEGLTELTDAVVRFVLGND